MRPTENKQVLYKFSTSSQSPSCRAIFRSYIMAGSPGHARLLLQSNDPNRLGVRIPIDINPARNHL